MDFQDFKQTARRDRDYPERQHELAMRIAVRDGQLYASLIRPFHVEKDDSGQYIPLRQRRPSVRYNLCRVVVDDSVSLLFADGHFPAIECSDEATRDALTALAMDTELPAIMVDAATRGSVGSVAIHMRVLSGRLFWAVYDTQFLTPTWRADAPDTLAMVREQYKVKGKVLAGMGYTVPKDDAESDYWFRRDFTDAAEVWHMPVKCGTPEAEAANWPVDTAKTTPHGLGFVPLVWVKNLPGGNGVDGACTFPDEAVDTMIELDYQLSQAGRALKYAGDPTLMIREPAVDNDGQVIRSAGNAVVVGPEGDAKMLEITGGAAAAVLEYVRACRELALEGAHGNRSNADKLSAAQSGRAMELMNQSLIWLADKLRTSYGTALLRLFRMAMQARAKHELVDSLGEKVPELKSGERLTLRWPHWYAPTYSDKKLEVATLKDATGGRQLLSQETAVKALATCYDVADAADELRQIKADGPMPDAKPDPEPKPGNEPGKED